MSWSLKTKEALAVTLLALGVVATTTFVHLAQLTRVVVEESRRQADLVAKQIYAQSGRALAARRGGGPREVLRRDRDLRSLVEASVGYSPHLLYALIADQDGAIIVHSERQKEGGAAVSRPDLRTLLTLDPLRRVYLLYARGQTYEAVLPVTLNGAPFGAIRIGVSTTLLGRELSAAVTQTLALAGLALPVAWLLALFLVNLVLRPVGQLARDVDRLRRGELEAPAAGGGGRTDELGELSAQLQLLSEQLRSDRVKSLSEKAHLQHVVEILEDGIIFFTPDRRVLFYNKATEAVVGRPLAEARGARPEELLPPGHALRAVLERAFADREDVRNATITLAVDEAPRELLVSVFFVADVQKAMGAMVLLRDLESIKTLQSLISYSAKLAALGRLTSGVAHEVKNPLNAMMIHLELARARLDASAPDVKESLDVIGSEIRRLDLVVQGFLKFIRPQELSLKAVDVNALLQSAVALLEPEWQPAGVRFDLGLDPTCPPLSADEDLLRQAFLNILVNACQAMPQGGTVSIATSWRRRDHVTVTIADEGVGIRPEDLDRIFSLYYTTKPGGSGIGLSIVYRIVQMHDGTIDVASEVGRRTIVTCRFPLR
ncbi:MAG: PAS domain-containing protein [Candidatus Rokubacteria bacterium]|nr:PAS domain-containing protein [Candidatus Rokubacteria bacterium]